MHRLKEELSAYVKIFGGKVKVMRSLTRLGLIRARTEGARAATGDVLVFLDAHCEATVGW